MQTVSVILDWYSAIQCCYKVHQNLSAFTISLHTARVRTHQAERVLSAFTSAWGGYMNMHGCRALGTIHQQSVQHATTVRLAADLRLRL